MATVAPYPRIYRSSILVTAFGVLLLAMALSFLAGRATVRPAYAHPEEVRPQAATQPDDPPPWATQGFRDDETAQDGCVTSDCTG